MYVACAVEGEADYIVSGDRHLRKLGAYQGIPIVTPTQFLTILADQVASQKGQ
jgi:predicted nucleic acid-binding protein